MEESNLWVICISITFKMQTHPLLSLLVPEDHLHSCSFGKMIAQRKATIWLFVTTCVWESSENHLWIKQDL